MSNETDKQPKGFQHLRPVVPGTSLSSAPSSTKQIAETRKEAATAAGKILSAYTTQVPDYYLPGLVETLCHLTSEEIGWLLDPREGIVTRCRFPPNAADIHECLRERCARRDAVMATRSTQYRYFTDSEPDQRGLKTLEERKAFLIEELGYDPAKGKKTATWCFDPEKPPVDAPWRDPKELEASAKRIKAEMGLVEFEPSPPTALKGDQV